MWLSLIVGVVGFGAFLLAGAALLSFHARNDRVAWWCARCSTAIGTVAVALSALWLSSAVLWPLEVAGVQRGDAPTHLLRAPMMAMVACSALAVVALPVALLVLRALARRRLIAHWSAELARDDEHHLLAYRDRGPPGRAG